MEGMVVGGQEIGLSEKNSFSSRSNNINKSIFGVILYFGCYTHKPSTLIFKDSFFFPILILSYS